MVDLVGYIIILINQNDKIKLYGSPADNADTLEVRDEILQVNGSTLENASQSEVTQYINKCIESRTICLRIRRRSGNRRGECFYKNLYIRISSKMGNNCSGTTKFKQREVAQIVDRYFLFRAIL